MIVLALSFVFASSDAATCDAKPVKAVKKLHASHKPRAMVPAPTPEPTPAVVASEPTPTPAAPPAPIEAAPVSLPTPVKALTPVLAPTRAYTQPSLGRAAWLLGALIVAAAALAWWKRRAPSSGSRSDIAVIASKAFGPKHRMEVVDVEGQRLLVSLSPDGLRLLCKLDRDQPLDAAAFERVLQAQQGSDVAPPASAEVKGILELKAQRSKRAVSLS